MTTLANRPMSDQAVAARVLDHIEHGTTDAGTDVWREPVANYRSPERFEREVSQVLRRFPAPFCPSASLPDKGSYVARDRAGVPIVVVRGQDGKVRAFRNACRHRGMRLADGSGCANAFMCRYHGWTYGLDGALRHVPHEQGFPGLDKQSHGLVPVRAEERAGLVFVTQEGANALGDLPDLISDDQILYATTEREIQANWKIFLEGFLEGYHIRATHPETFLPYGFDNLTLLETFGRNSRITFPFKRIKKLAAVAPSDRNVLGLVTYVYHLFPNALVTVLSSHTNVVILEPVAVDKTRFVSYSLTNRGAGTTEEAVAAAKRDAEFVGNMGAAEDRAVVEAIQRGLASGANEAFTFGHYESLIAHFHRQLANALAA
jgi:phenylpropionate dioxygenase-like ring-hydroxylating dioxygenase large terminal subunit